MKQPTQAQKAIRPGNRVLYSRDDGSMALHSARTTPQKLGGHTWVIWLTGVSGCIALSRIQPAPEAAP